MKKRIILLLFIIVSLTGCNAQYNLTITEDGFSETIYINSENSSDDELISDYEKPLETFIDSPVRSESFEKTDDIPYYDTVKYEENNRNAMKLANKFSKEDYNRSNIVNTISSSFKYYDTEGVYKIHAGSYFKCFDMYNNINNLKITVKLSNNYEIVNSNADENSNNTLTWRINRSNYKDSPIILSYQDKYAKSSSVISSEIPASSSSNIKETTGSSLDNYALYIFCGVLLIIILVGYHIFNKMKNKNNGMDD